MTLCYKETCCVFQSSLYLSSQEAIHRRIQKKISTRAAVGNPTGKSPHFTIPTYECKSKSTLVDFHHANCWSPNQYRWGEAITKNFFTSWPGLSLDLVHKHLSGKNQPYLGTFSNLERASDQHRKRLSNKIQIQNKTSSHHPHSQRTPIFSSSRQWISQEKIIRTKQEGPHLHPARATSISWSPIIMTTKTSM